MAGAGELPRGLAPPGLAPPGAAVQAATTRARRRPTDPSDGRRGRGRGIGGAGSVIKWDAQIGQRDGSNGPAAGSWYTHGRRGWPAGWGSLAGYGFPSRTGTPCGPGPVRLSPPDGYAFRPRTKVFVCWNGRATIGPLLPLPDVGGAPARRGGRRRRSRDPLPEARPGHGGHRPPPGDHRGRRPSHRLGVGLPRLALLPRTAHPRSR